MMADLRNCSQCGRVYAYQGNKLCSKCLESMEKDFAKVRKYLRTHPGAGIQEVKEATDVEEKYILDLIREGRLIAEGLGAVLSCERCGTAIREGRYCERCRFSMDQEFKAVLPSPGVQKPAASSRAQEEMMFIKKKSR